MSPARDREFQKLWAGQTISEIGSRISREGLPLTAVMILGATPAQMGILAATGGASALVFSLAAGVFVDRVRRRPVMIWADVARCLVLATVPLAAALHRLSFLQVLIVAAVTGLLTVLFDVAYQSYLPSLIPSQALLQGNRLLGMSAASAEILGPAMTGVLIKALTAPRAILLDALSFLASTISVAAIQRPENERPPSVQTHWREEALAGAKVIWAHPLLRALALRSITAFLFMGFLFCLYLLYAIRDLGMSTPALGLTVALGGVGSLCGAYLSERVSTRFGTGRAFFGSAVVVGLTSFLIPLAALKPSRAILFMGAAQLIGDGAWSIYVVNETALRQRLIGEELLGRVNAAMQIASRGMLPIGALAGGYVATFIGTDAALFIASAGVFASCFFLLPIRGHVR